MPRRRRDTEGERRRPTARRRPMPSPPALEATRGDGDVPRTARTHAGDEPHAGRRETVGGISAEPSRAEACEHGVFLGRAPTEEEPETGRGGDGGGEVAIRVA